MTKPRVTMAPKQGACRTSGECPDLLNNPRSMGVIGLLSGVTMPNPVAPSCGVLYVGAVDSRAADAAALRLRQRVTLPGL